MHAQELSPANTDSLSHSVSPTQLQAGVTPLQTPQQSAQHGTFSHQQNITAAMQGFHPVTYQASLPLEYDSTVVRVPRTLEELHAIRNLQQTSRMMDKLAAESTKPVMTSLPSANIGGFANTSASAEERYQLLLERESKWAEVRKYSEFIRRFATEASHVEISKEYYYDLYNMAVCLLKAVDSLDPDKAHNLASQRKASDFELSPNQLGHNATNSTPLNVNTAVMSQAHNGALGQSDLELLQSTRKSFDYYYNRNSLDASNLIPKYTSDLPLLYNNSTIPASTFLNVLPPSYPNVAVPKAAADTKQKSTTFNNTDPLFEDLQQDDAGVKRPKRQRRRRTVYSTRRNLHCHMCGVTETPEWRRGPAGDHTLCNACGLHYAKSLKKQRKEREGRKHSIEMLLNQQLTNTPTTTESPTPT
jgi:hypothetical protein